MRTQYTPLLMLVSLGACTAPVAQTEATSETSQALVTPAQYRITPSYTSAECLSTVGGNTSNWGSADTWSCSNSPDPDWNVVQISSGVYELRQAASGECLTAANGSFANGNSLVLWECTGGNGTRWNVVPSGADYTFQSVNDSSKCIDVNRNGTADGTTVQVWDCSGSQNQKFMLTPSAASQLATGLKVTQTSSSKYTAALTVTNTTNMTINNWQVAVQMEQSHIDQIPSYGGTTGITNGSVYFNNGLAIVTPANGATLAAGASVQVSFTGDIDGSDWWPEIVSIDGISGSVAPLANDGINHIQRASATAALNVMEGYESSRESNDRFDFAVLDSHMYTVSSDGSQIIFDPANPGYLAPGYVSSAATQALAAAQSDPSVASYLVSGLLSCFADDGPDEVYGFNAAALNGWSYRTTPENISITSFNSAWFAGGSDNISRVAANVNGVEQITLTETVSPNSSDFYFGLVAGIKYAIFEGPGGRQTKFHGDDSFPCSPFNGPGGAANPYLLISVNGSQIGARQKLSNSICTSSSHCVSTAVLDPVAYASPGQFYDTNNNLIGPSVNPFLLDPNVALGYNPDHQGQWAQDVYSNWGEFSKRVFIGGSYKYRWTMCPGGTFSAGGC